VAERPAAGAAQAEPLQPHGGCGARGLDRGLGRRGLGRGGPGRRGLGRGGRTCRRGRVCGGRRGRGGGCAGRAGRVRRDTAVRGGSCRPSTGAVRRRERSSRSVVLRCGRLVGTVPPCGCCVLGWLTTSVPFVLLHCYRPSRPPARRARARPRTRVVLPCSGCLRRAVIPPWCRPR